MANKSKQHIVQQFDAELKHLEEMLLEMGNLVEDQMVKVLQSLGDRNFELAEQVCATDTAIDNMEYKIDDMCALMIAKRQPAARDMRKIMTTIRSIWDLERIGDEITKIARSNIAMSEEKSLPKGASQVQRIGTDVAAMLKKSLNAIVQGDVQAAIVVAKADKEIDQHCTNAILGLSRSMAENPSQIDSCINLLWIIRSLERIGDRACNLTEHVVYLVHGKDIRHIYDYEELKNTVDK